MESPATETPAQKQVRIRREKREKKILEGSASRLDKITSLSGRPLEQATSSPTPETSSSSTSPKADPSSAQAQDSTPQQPGLLSDTRSSDQNELEANMRRLLRSAGTEPSRAAPAAAGMSAQDEEQPDNPIMSLLQQMMGAPPPDPGAGDIGPQPGALPPNLASMLDGGMPAGHRPDQSAVTNAYIWKITHACLALMLTLYILFSFAFTGSQASRLRFTNTSEASSGSIFWPFLAAELGLQAARYLLEGNRQEFGMLGTVAGILPPPWKERLLLGGRYSGMWSTVVQDAMVVVWLLGIVAWWKEGSM